MMAQAHPFVDIESAVGAADLPAGWEFQNRQTLLDKVPSSSPLIWIVIYNLRHGVL
jgi:hypothetical protein